MRYHNLIKKLEQISSIYPNKILRIKGYVTENKKKEYLEILIYKGFSSSTTHPIEKDLEKNVIKKIYTLSKAEMLEAPLSEKSNPVIKENKDIRVFLEIGSWH